MNLAEKIALISIEYTQDNIGEWTETRSETEVFALVESVSMSEFYQAGMQGFKPEFKMSVWMNEYSGQELISYNDKTYTIYRTYMVPDSDTIELYAERRGGTNGKE